MDANYNVWLVAMYEAASSVIDSEKDPPSQMRQWYEEGLTPQQAVDRWVRILTKPALYEVPVYCGKMKEWRILNVSTGTVYSMSFESEAAAAQAIEDGEERAGFVVRRFSLADLRAALMKHP